MEKIQWRAAISSYGPKRLYYKGVGPTGKDYTITHKSDNLFWTYGGESLIGRFTKLEVAIQASEDWAGNK